MKIMAERDRERLDAKKTKKAHSPFDLDKSQGVFLCSYRVGASALLPLRHRAAKPQCGWLIESSIPATTATIATSAIRTRISIPVI
jgi:hypothetical protein